MRGKAIYATFVGASMSEIASVQKKYHTTEGRAFDMILNDKRTAYSNLMATCGNIKTNGNPILCLEFIGSYGNRVAGHTNYKVLSDNLKDCFTLFNSGRIEWCLVGNDLICIQRFDTGEYREYLFRQVKSNVTKAQLDDFCNRHYNGMTNYDDVKKYTVSIGKYFSQYRWFKPME